MPFPGDPSNWLDATGHYDDALVRTSDGWQISRRISRVARLLTEGDAAAALSAQGRTRAVNAAS
jgi:hypothetical protein